MVNQAVTLSMDEAEYVLKLLNGLQFNSTVAVFRAEYTPLLSLLSSLERQLAPANPVHLQAVEKG